MELNIEKLIENQYDPGFKIGLHLKDLNNALQAAQSQNTSIPFTNEVTEIMRIMNEQGMGDMYHTIIFTNKNKDLLD